VRRDAADSSGVTDPEQTSAGLSSDDLDSLLAEVAGKNTKSKSSIRATGPQPFDFRRPNKFSRDHVRALQIVNETFARQFGTILSSTLRAVSTVQLSSIGQLTYDEFVQSMPNPTIMAVLSLEPLNGAAIFYMPIPLAMAAIDRILGGPGAPAAGGAWPIRALSEIETTLIRGILDRALNELAYAFESLVEIEPTIGKFEYNPQFAQIAGPADMMVVAAFDGRIGNELGGLGLCIPFSSLQPILERATAHTVFVERNVGDPAAVQAAVTARLESAPVEVSVRFRPITLTSGEIVSLREGDVLSLHHRTDEPLTVSAAGQPYLHAMPGKKGKRLAVLISEPTRTTQ
jgi:flagellar motor switch protein FliM